MRNNWPKFLKRSDYLKCLDKVYEETSTDYLLALRDGLSIVIAQRLHFVDGRYDSYVGYVKYDQ